MEDNYDKGLYLRLNKVMLKHCDKRVEELNKTYMSEFRFSIQSYIRRLIYEDMKKK